MPRRSPAPGHRSIRLAPLAAIGLALGVQACGGGGGGGGGTTPPVDHARLDACVLVAAAVTDGCTTSGGSPVAELGDLAMGDERSRVVAVYNGGDGTVDATVSAIALGPTPATHYALALFALDGHGAEVPATLPFPLKPNHGSELRARVTFTALVAAGAVQGTSLTFTTTHPQGSIAVPVTANVTGCATGRGDCDGDPSNACEVDLKADVLHCGTCAGACSTDNGTPSCTDGICAIACAAGFANCNGGVEDGCEADLAADPAHCGGCAVACDATHGTATCAAGACGITCAAGFADCDGSTANGCEVDLSSDAAHCGACATTCDSTHGASSCSGGACGIACADGFADCDGSAANGCEVDLSSDLAHCGGCATACDATHGSASCASGVCGITCADGFADCDADVRNGCEVELASDPNHCATCSTTCDATNGTATCTAGACGVTCASGFADCDGSAGNGCEVSLQTDAAHCASCSNACDATHGTATCSAGACGITCAAGFADCDGDPANGCEVDVNADPLHCGACSGACSTTHGTASCTAGTCGITCATGFSDCDGNPATGCEADLGNDPLHCGACVVACDGTNGAPSCTGGFCGISCAPGFASCDGTVANGCEASLESDPAHCGSCVTACSNNNASPTCAAGACAVTCAPGFADCDGDVTNGCEVDVLNDPSHCGTCGSACDATNGAPVCGTGTCGIVCDPGYADCDGDPANGCEVNLTSDQSHCGGCNVACGAPNSTSACTGGTCTISACQPSYGDCDLLYPDGCETGLSNNPNHCGACGNACTPRPNTVSTVCGGVACQVASCQPGWFDVDGAYADGCECRGPWASQTCAAPTSLGSVPAGSTVSISDSLLPGGEVYVLVNFPPSYATYGGGAPHLYFASNPGGMFVFDVLTDCAGGAYGCGVEGGVANGVSDYSFTDDQSPAYLFRTTAWPSTVLVRVRSVASACGSFTLAAAR